MISIVGFLSGMEIPLVSNWFKETNEEKSNEFILGADYFGTVVGCVIFPFLLLPKLGLFSTALLMGSINLMISMYMFYKLEQYNKKHIFAMSLLVLTLILTFYYLNDISDYVVGKAFA